MDNNNDDKISALLLKIEDKEKKLNTKDVPFKTGMIISDNKTHTNMHTRSISYLVNFSAEVRAFSKECIKLGVPDELIYNHSPKDWLHDVKELVRQKTSRKEQVKLQKMKQELSGLMSGDKQTSMAVDKIAKMLG